MVWTQQKQKILRRGDKNTQKNYTKKDLHEYSCFGTVVKKQPVNAGYARDVGLIPGSGRSLGGGNGNPLQYSCLENAMDRGAWRATVHELTRS